MEAEKITVRSHPLIRTVVIVTKLIGYEITWAEIRMHDYCVYLLGLGYLSSSGC
jgi:hypothetical protein